MIIKAIMFLPVIIIKNLPTQIKNWWLIQKYPWLMPGIEHYNYLYTEYDNLPVGWKRTFGKHLLKDINNRLKDENYEYEFKVYQIKEKYGSLRFYCDSIVDDIVDQYEVISEHTCAICGRFDVPMINHYGWYIPMCLDCFKKIDKKLSYTECMCSDRKTPNYFVMRTYLSTGGIKETMVDISKTVEKIRKKAHKKEWLHTFIYRWRV